jgi:hypothetical protein
MYFKGFSHWLQVNLYAEGRLYWDIEDDAYEIAKDWATKQYGRDAADVIAGLLTMSTEVVRKGLYIKAYAEKNTMLPSPWIRWMLVFDGPLLRDIYEACKETLEETIQEGIEAFKFCEIMIANLEKVQSSINDSELYSDTLYSLLHEKSLMETLMYYRECFLRYYESQERRNESKRGKILVGYNDLVKKLIKAVKYYQDNYDYYQLDGIEQFLSDVQKDLSI